MSAFRLASCVPPRAVTSSSTSRLTGRLPSSSTIIGAAARLLPTTPSRSLSSKLPFHVNGANGTNGVNGHNGYTNGHSHHKDIGIVAMDIYFPSQYVAQEDLETHDKVGKGKYTVGLGQHGLAYCGDREDIYSMCMTAVQGFMEKYNLQPKDIGRLEVATETILDHAKAIKTVLMQLFEASGNTDIEGVDTMNACYAGTTALFNSLAWVESTAWDGRYAMVVAADIAEYAVGPARPTGGAGAVVYLIGPNAPLVPSPVRASHMEHAYDFYKPNLESPYPVVDGKFSNTCYLRALDICYQRYAQKFQKSNGGPLSVDSVDYFLFHSPYSKLVQKSYARAVWNDFLIHPTKPQYASLLPFQNMSKDESYSSSALEKACVEVSKSGYAAKVTPASLLPKNLGNMYTGSLYAGLLSLLYTQHSNLAGKNMLMFSYGSGLAASLFSINVRNDAESVRALTRIRDTTKLEDRLKARIKSTPVDFNQAMTIRENLHVTPTYTPVGSTSILAPGTFYLVNKDQQSRRFYQRKAMN